MKHRSEIGQFCFCCKMFDRKTWNYVELFLRILFLWSRMDVMYFTRHVVAWHATCQSPIGSYRLLGGNMLTSGILTRGIFWSDGPRLPSFDRTATNMQNLKKKLRTGREFVDTWRVKYITSIRDHRTKICKKVRFAIEHFTNKSKTGRFQADVSCWTCGNSKCLP